MAEKWWSKVLHLAGIVLMGLTAAFTIMGGAGTSCVAINPSGFGGSFSGIAPYQWLYISFVLVTLAFGVMGARAALLLVRSRANAYRYALISLLGGTLVGVIHMLVSRALRGSSMPVDMVTYVSVITLAVFLLFRLPGVWVHIDFGKPHQSSQAGTAGGLSAVITGAVCLTVQYWMGPTHTIGGVNYADAWHVPFQVVGWALVAAGLTWLVYTSLLPVRRRVPANMLA